MKLDEYRDRFLEILREHSDGRWWPSYTIWARFEARFPNEANSIIEEYHGRIGAGGGGPGGNYGMVSHVSHSLSRIPEIVEKEFLHTQGLTFGEVKPSDPTIAIFRLRSAR